MKEVEAMQREQKSAAEVMKSAFPEHLSVQLVDLIEGKIW